MSVGPQMVSSPVMVARICMRFALSCPELAVTEEARKKWRPVPHDSEDTFVSVMCPSNRNVRRLNYMDSNSGEISIEVCC